MVDQDKVEQQQESQREQKQEEQLTPEQQSSAESSQEGNDRETSVDELAALEVDELISIIHDTKAKADENWNVALRVKAEMENVRKRTEREVANARKYGIEKLASEFLPVRDSMEMGLQAAIELDVDDAAVHKIREGMELTLKMMEGAMEKVGLKVVDPSEGDDFNHEYHQAMTMQAVEGKKSNTIVSVMQKGYLLNDRLIRPAMVIVAK